MAKVDRSEQRREQRRWNGILRRERLSMDRGRPNQLTYVNPEDLASIPDEASDPAIIIEAIEKVKGWLGA